MATNPYLFGTPLNFGQVPAYDDYPSAYANALSLNQQLYGQILGGYQSLMSGQMSAQQAIQQGYTNLSGAVMGDIQGIGRSQQQAINDAYAAQQGQAAQGLTSRGLGNTTVANSVQRGLTLDKQKADIALANQMAQLTAGYRSQLGLAGLNYGNQANMQNTALASQQLGFMNSVNAPYPNAKDYMNLEMMRGAASMMNRIPYGAGGGGFGGGGTIDARRPLMGGLPQGGGYVSTGAPRVQPIQFRGAGQGGSPQTLDFPEGGAAGAAESPGSLASGASEGGYDQAGGASYYDYGGGYDAGRAGVGSIAGIFGSMAGQEPQGYDQSAAQPDYSGSFEGDTGYYTDEGY